jgi:hypothetical protein
MADYDLQPSELISYGQQRRSAFRNALSGINNIGRQAQQLDTNYANDFNQAQRSWDQSRAAFPRSFNQRGLMTSGIYNRQMRNFDTSRQEAFGKLAQDYYNQRANLANAAEDYQQNYEIGYGDIGDQEQMRRAMIAARLNGGI